MSTYHYILLGSPRGSTTFVVMGIFHDWDAMCDVIEDRDGQSHLPEEEIDDEVTRFEVARVESLETIWRPGIPHRGLWSVGQPHWLTATGKRPEGWRDLSGLAWIQRP